MVGDELQLQCVAIYNKGPSRTCSTTVEWTSSIPSVVVFNAPGVITAVSPGNSQITVSLNGITSPPVVVKVVLPPVTFVSFSVIGDTILEAPGPLQLNAVAEYSDGTTSVLPHNAVVWSYDNYLVGKVDSLGVVRPNGLGSLQICASYLNLQECLQIQVVGTPEDELPPLSTKEARRLAQSAIASNGMVVGWANGLTTVWSGQGVSQDSVVKVMDFLSVKAEGELPYTLVSDSASARLSFVVEEGPRNPDYPSGYCGFVRSQFEFESNAWVSATVVVRSDCKITAGILGHEILHALGIRGHSEKETGDMLSSWAGFYLSSPLAEALRWILFVTPGTIPLFTDG
jgi:hypothetical protein